ncbi:unnamed protein product [Ectocarpus sp. CCAP 1310/34]|nr:unnamed protein product [Ectocarpus sp. CCAP 1310/34]
MVRLVELRAVLTVLSLALAALHHQQQLLVALLRQLHREEDEEDDEEPRPKRRRTVRPRADYRTLPWARMLEKADLLQDPSTREAKQFRRRFRVPYPFFLSLVDEVKAGNWPGFTTDEFELGGRGTRRCIPVETKVLAVLRILGRGNYFDDVSEVTGMGEATVNHMFHKFTERFAREFFPVWVRMPNEDELKDIMKTYDEVGMSGAMGSMDGTHIEWTLCPYSQRTSHIGKEGYATLVYNVAVSHDMRVLSCTRGFPGAQNDKTIIKFDKFAMAVRNGWYKDVEYTLKGEDGADIKEKGPWLIVDGGYHNWKQLQSPIRAPSNKAESGFKRQLESVRKDSECCFGVVKGRFRICKMQFLYRKKERIDNIFFTCIILHNMLLAYDGIELLEPDCDWAGADGDLDKNIEHPVVRMSAPTHEDAVVECDDGFDALRQKLVTNFAYRWGQGTVGWKRS